MGIRSAHFIQRYPPALGGSEAYFARLGKYLAAAGDRVTVFTSAALSLEAFWSRRGRCFEPGESCADGVSVRRYGPCRWPGRRYLLKLLSLIPQRTWQGLTMPCNPISFRMWRDCGRAEQPFDIVHASAFPYAWPIICARRLARRLGVPFLLTPFLHLGDPADPADPTRRSYTAPALVSLLRSADGIFVQTPGERTAIENLGIGPGKIILQGLGVEPSECDGGDRAAIRRVWGVQDSEVVIGHLANNSKEKGTTDLLLAVQRLWRCRLPVRVVLAGPEMPNFLSFWPGFAADLPPQAVLRLGILDDRQKRDFLAGLDVFALPSRSDSFGLVLLEAWVNGLPNVAYRAGGIADVIRHEEDGLLVPCGNTDALAEALTRLSQDSQLRRRLGMAGRERLPREFRWDDKLAMVREVYYRHCPGRRTCTSELPGDVGAHAD